MKNEIARDVVAAQPIDAGVQNLLQNTYRFSPNYIDFKDAELQAAIQGDLDVLEVMQAYTQPSASQDSPDFPSTPVIRPELEPLAKIYEGVAADPIDKHDFDSDFISSFLSKLGPTNHLRRQDGIDAAFELAHLVHILELDFAALPEVEKTAERRMTEGYLREELALLWAPNIPSRSANVPAEKRGFIFNLDDPNVLTEEQIEKLSDKDKWKMIGAHLAHDAADIFSAVIRSSTAPVELKMEALSRTADMRVRGFKIQTGITASKQEKQALQQEIKNVSKNELRLIDEAWNNPEKKKQIKTGKLYESVMLAMARNDLITSNNPDQTIRLALPREDAIHQNIQPWINRNGVLVNLSSDLIVEDANGNFVRAYQVKAMTERKYELEMHQRELDKGKVMYPKERIKMVFLDDNSRQVVSAVEVS